MRLAAAADVGPRWNVKVDGAEVYFGALLRHLGCTSTATTETRLMGDEHELRSSLALSDAASPASLFNGARHGFGVGVAQHWEAFSETSGPLERAAAALPDAELALLKQKLADAIAPFATAQGLRIPGVELDVSGER